MGACLEFSMEDMRVAFISRLSTLLNCCYCITTKSSGGFSPRREGRLGRYSTDSNRCLPCVCSVEGQLVNPARPSLLPPKDLILRHGLSQSLAEDD